MFVEAQLLAIFLFNLFFINLIKKNIIKILISLVLNLFLFLEILSFLMTGDLIDYRFYIHSNLDSVKTYFFQFKKEFTIMCIVFFLINIFTYKVTFTNLMGKKIKYVIIAFLFIVITLPNKSAIQKIYQISKIYNQQNFYFFKKNKSLIANEYNDFAETYDLNNFLDKKKLISEKNYNIIYLTLESLDSRFIINTPELTKNLNKLKKKWNYTEIKKTEGCDWSAGSLYCLMTGLPSFFPFEKNKIFHQSKKINIVTLGDILKKSNFQNIDYIVGESSLVGSGDLLKSMHFNVIDNTNISSNFKKYPDTFGFHDKDLFYELKKKIVEYNKNQESFAIFAATINTHLNGIKDERMSKIIGNDFKNNIEHSVNALDFLIGDFITFLENQKILQNTVLFIAPDHMFPKNKALHEVNKRLGDSNENLFLISNKKIINNAPSYQVNLPEIISDTALIKRNNKFFFEKNKIKDINEFINENKSLFSNFNKSNLIYSNPPKLLKFKIENNVFGLIDENKNYIYRLNLKNKGPSYINLLFDSNFIFKNDEYKKESSSIRKIRKEDERYNYQLLTLFKNNNEIINGKFISGKDKLIYKIDKINNNLVFNVQSYKLKKKENIKIDNPKKFIAHAGGSIDNIKYLNTLEALNINYKKGFRYFELDLQKTSDNHIVATHDWELWQKQTGYKKSLPPNFQNFMQYKILKKYTPLAHPEINNWFLEHKDAYLVTDKINDAELFSEQILVNKTNIIVETFDLKSSMDFINRGYKIMPNYYFLKNLNDPLQFLNENNIQFVTISQKNKKNLYPNLFNNFKNFIGINFEKKLLNNGIKFYAYNLNEKDKVSEKIIICEYSDIFFGIYADNWDFNKGKIECN
jgi:hypothetical protein